MCHVKSVGLFFQINWINFSVPFFLEIATMVAVAVPPVSIVALTGMRRSFIPAARLSPLAFILARAFVTAAVVVIVASPVSAPLSIIADPMVIVSISMAPTFAFPVTVILTATGVFLPVAINAFPVIIVPLVVRVAFTFPVTVSLAAARILLPFTILATPVVIVPLSIFVRVAFPVALSAAASSTTTLEIIDGIGDQNRVDLMNDAIRSVNVGFTNARVVDLYPRGGNVGFDAFA